jgi:F420-non-reducing hydrogenase iron-sulfur subunit
MVIKTTPRIIEEENGSTNQKHKPNITVFHCFNALNSTEFLADDSYEIKSVILPCSSLNREVVLLRAFEAGADAVVVLACPEGTCRYVQGNLRAAKRVARVKKILDEIGIGGKRLNFFNIPHNNSMAVQNIIEQTLSGLIELGPNPVEKILVSG